MDIDESNSYAITVPITVDSVKETDSYRMTRCTYFSIECSEPAPGWSLRTSDIDVQFFMIGLSGVITAPPGGDQFFDTPDQLDHLFNVIEQNKALYVETNDIWLPNDLFLKSGMKPHRGQVYRIGGTLFRAAYLLKEDIRSDDEFMLRIKDMNIPEFVKYSENETEALMVWNKKLIDINREYYHANPEKKLLKKDDYQRPEPTPTLEM